MPRDARTVAEERIKKRIREYVGFGLVEVFAYEMMFVTRVPSVLW